jgi:3-oxoacyl-[acyl-carrier protein] reductase
MDCASTGAVVTGGSGTIGAAVVDELARAGTDVTVAYHADESGADAAAEAARDRGVRAQTVRADVTDPAEAAALIETAADFTDLCIVVHCAGVTELQAVEDVTGDAIQRSFAVDVEGAMNVAAPAVGSMRDRRSDHEHTGAVVAVSSVAALSGTVSIPYAAAKAGLVGAMRALARECGTDGITANVVCPGPVESAVNDEIIEYLEDQRFRGHQTVDTLLGRYEAQPEEVAEAVAFLAGHGFVTGETLSVDGGLTL